MATGEINEALSAIGAFGKALRKNTAQYTDFIDKMEASNSTSTDRKELREQERGIKAMQQTTSALEKLQDKAADLEVEHNNGTKTARKSIKEFKRLAKEMNKVTPGSFTEDIIDSFDTLSKDSRGVSAAFGMVTEAANKQAKVSEENVNAGIKTLKQTYATNFALKDNVSALKTSAKGFFSFDKSMALIVSSLMRQSKELTAAQQQQVGVYGVLGEEFISTAYHASLVPAAMQKFVAGNVDSFLSTAEGYSSLDDAVRKNVKMLSEESEGRQSIIDRSYDLTGSFEDGSKLIGTTMSILKGFGEKVPLDQLASQSNVLMDSFQGLAKLSNKTTQEVADMTARLLNSDAIRTKMIKLTTANERRQAQIDLMANIKRNEQLGLSLETAFALAEKSASLQDRGYIDRLKQSYSLGILADQVGMGANAQELGELSRSTSLNEKQQERFELLLGELYSKFQKVRGSGDVDAASLEFIAGPLGQLLDVGKIAAQRETEAGKSITDSIAAMVDTIQDSTAGIMRDAFKWWDGNIKPVIGDAMTTLAAGIAGVVSTSIAAVMKNFMGIRTILGKAFSSGTQAGGSLLSSVKGLAMKGLDIAKTQGSKMLQFGKSFLPSIATLVKSLGTMLMRVLPAAMATSLAFLGGRQAGDLAVKGVQSFDKAYGTDAWGSVVDTVGAGTAKTVDFVDKAMNTLGIKDTTASPKPMLRAEVSDKPPGATMSGSQINANTLAAIKELNTTMTMQHNTQLAQLEATNKSGDGITKVSRAIEENGKAQKEQNEEQLAIADEANQFNKVGTMG